MESALPIVSLLIGLGVGGSAVSFYWRQRLTVASQSLLDTQGLLSAALADLSSTRELKATFEERAKTADQLRLELSAKEERLSELLEDIAAFREERSRLETEMSKEREAFEEQKGLLDEAQKKLADAFNSLSSDALRKNNQAFLELAKETLQSFNKDAQGELEKKQQAIDTLVAPLKESLDKVDVHIKALEEKRASAYATLSEQVKSLADTQTRLQSETSNLVKALRNPNQRGRWGEIQLKRVVELSGMLEHCDFHEQQTTTSEGGAIRPDITVKLPNAKTIVVDSKTPLDAYLTAIEATEEVVRADAYRSHARQVREHIRQLSNKRYWDQFSEATPELVVMFIPGEAVYSAALEQDPQLIEYGVENKVLIATPTTLIGLLKAVAYGWRQERLEENAQKISQLGRDLYGRMASLADHFTKVGRSLDRAVGSYNDAVGCLENRVLPQARKFKELQAAAAEDIDALEPIDKTARSMQRSELKTTATTTVVASLFQEAVS